MGSSSRYNLLSIGTEEDGLDRRTVDEGLDDLTLEAELDGGASEADSAVQATRAAEVPTPAPKRTATRKPPTRKTAGSSTTRSASSNGTRASSNGSGKAKPDDKPLSDETLSAAVDPEPAATAAEEPSSDGEPQRPADQRPADQRPADQRPADQRPADLADASEAGKAGEEKKDEPESPTAVIPAMPADDIFAPRPGKTAASAASAVEPSPLAAEPSPRTEGSPLKEGWGTVKPGERPRGNAFDVDDAFSAPPMPPDQTVRTSPFTSSKSSSPKLSAASADASGQMAASQTSTAPSQAFPRPAVGPATKGKPKATVRRSTARQAHLTISRVEPWSVMKFSFAVSVVAFIVLFVAVAVLFAVLSALGVFDSLQHLVNNVTSSQNSAGYNVKKWFTASRVLGYTVLLGGLNIVLITAMSTIGAVIYNLTSRLIGGVEVTLKETD